MRSSTQHRIWLSDRFVDYRLVRSKTALSLRVRVGPDGVEVVQPTARKVEDVLRFLAANQGWVLEQLDRADLPRRVRRTVRHPLGEILFQGELTRVRIEATHSGATGNAVRFIDDEIIVSCGPKSRTPVARSLELWLRRQPRLAINGHLARVLGRLGQRPERIYVMGQRTK